MAKAGLITRHADSDDGRATRLYLTDAGHAALKHARVLLRELNGKLVTGFPTTNSMSSRAGCMRCRSGFRRSAERHLPASSPALTGTHRHSSKAIPIRIFDSIFMPPRRHYLRARRPLPATLSGYALLQNCLPGGNRIAYIAIHLDTFVACPGKSSRPVDIADTPDNQ